MQHHAERRSVHRLHADFTAGRMLGIWRTRVIGAARDELRYKRNGDRVRDGNLAHRIDRYPTPLEHTEVTWEHERALGGWRRERALVAHALEHDPASELIENRRAPHVGSAQLPFRPERKRGKRLRGRRMISRRRALRDRTLGRGHDRLTRSPIQ